MLSPGSSVAPMLRVGHVMFGFRKVYYKPHKDRSIKTKPSCLLMGDKEDLDSKE